jgi:AcrR family transcriptional regulator
VGSFGSPIAEFMTCGRFRARDQCAGSRRPPGLLARTSWHGLTVDDICADAGASKGAFYSYFDRKQDLLHALLDDEAAAIERLLSDLAAQQLPAIQQLRQFAHDTLQRAADPARVQIRADLWASLAGQPATRERFAATVRRLRVAVRELIERGIADGELSEVPANALASILLALSEGLVLHGALDPKAFRWANVYRAMDAVLDGVQHGGVAVGAMPGTD